MKRACAQCGKDAGRYVVAARLYDKRKRACAQCGKDALHMLFIGGGGWVGGWACTARKCRVRVRSAMSWRADHLCVRIMRIGPRPGRLSIPCGPAAAGGAVGSMLAVGGEDAIA